MGILSLAYTGFPIVIAGLFVFLRQTWLNWYAIDYGEWGPDNYDMFIPQILSILKWDGMFPAAAGVVLILIGKHLESKENKQS